MKYTLTSFIALLSATSFGAFNTTAQAPQRMLEYDTSYVAIATPVLSNPALSSLRHSVSNTDISAGYRHLSLDKAPIAAMGKGSGLAFFDAKTYMHLDNATITGHASYNNGKIYDLNGCETTDANWLFPYFSADEICGDMNREEYSFGGSYASSFGDSWIYGAQIDYTATQDWRQVDPRPKNIVGKLNLQAAIGRRVGAYAIALGFDALKYRQSSSIKFVSELGASKIYHTTGLGSDYTRFAGTGLSTNYSGWRYGADISFYPDNIGFFGTASYHRFTFDKQLNDLNRLPLNSAYHTDWYAMAGWKCDNIIVSLDFGRCRRTGFDNIFGDAAGQVYPEIASIPTYFMRSWNSGLQALWRTQGAKHRFDFSADFDYSHRLDCYISAPEDRRMRIDAISYGIGAEWVWQCASLWMLHIQGNADIVSPAKCTLTGMAHASGFLTESVLNDYTYAAHSRAYYNATIGIDRILSNGRTIGLRIRGTLASAASNSNGEGVEAAAIFSF